MAWMFLTIGLIVYASELFCLAQSQQVTTPLSGSLLPTAEIFTCDDIGYKGATLNKCGYCVNGDTLQADDFGVGCDATCGKTYIDCAGSCNGQAYIDDCSGKCVLDYQPIAKMPQEGNATIGQNAKFRDCSGLCRISGQSDSNAFVLDECGVCVAPPDLTTSKITNVTNITTIPSLYKDCSGTCYHPASTMLMAVNSSNNCDQCIGPRTIAQLYDFKDVCGNCKSANIPCSCTKAQLDICGVCNGQNDSCITIAKVFPAVIPSDTSLMVSVIGVSMKSKHHTICLFIRQDVGVDGKDEERFSAEVHDSTITCNVRLSEGIYKLYLAVLVNENQVLNMSNTSLPFVVYSKAATITSMEPTSTTISDDHDNFTVSFNAQNINRIRIVYCTIFGPGYDTVIRTTSPNITNGLVNCSFPYPPNSSMAKVIVSFDGETSIAGPFTITFLAAAPRVTDAFILPEGLSSVIFFDRNIDSIVNLSTCDAIFMKETLDRLGKDAKCTWVTKRQLIVTLGNTANSNPGTLASTLTFRDQVLYPENETNPEFSKNLSLSLVPSDEVPIAILVGPRRIPPCGTFTLDGHQSIGIQNRHVRFIWGLANVSHSFRHQNPSNPNGTHANETLEFGELPGEFQVNVTESNAGIIRFLQDATRKNLASIVIQADLLELEEPYNFTLTVINSVGARNRSSTAHLVVVQEMQLIPTVMIEPSIAHFPGFVSIDKGFTLHAYMAMPACQHEIYAIEYKWSVSSPKIKFDFEQMKKTSYHVKPWTLFPSKNVTFTVLVTVNSNPNMSSKASITFDVVSSKVKLVVSGGYQRSIGNSSGTLVVNASQSYHVDTPYLPLVYRWSCIDQNNNNPCYNYDPASDDILLIPKPITRSSVLSLPTSKLRPGSALNFNVQAYSPLNTTQVSGVESVLIRVRNGSEPVVSIDEVLVRDTKIQKPEFENIAYLIPPKTDVIVVASVNHSAALRDISWSIPGFLYDLKPFAVNASNGVGNYTTASIQIPNGYLVPNGIYQINITVMDQNGASGWAVSSFTVLSPVVGCEVNISEYKAFEMIPVYISECAVSDHNKPLSYQVYFYHHSSLVSLAPPQYHLPADVMGPPSVVNGKDENVFAVKVCDVMNSCWWFNSSAVKVRPSGDMHATSEHTFLMANVAKLTGDYLACLRRHALYLWAIRPSYRIKNEIEYESQLAEALICAKSAAEVQCNDTNCYSNLFTLLMAVPIETQPGRDFLLLEIIDKAIAKLDHSNLTLTPTGAQEAFLILEKIYKYNVSNNATAKLVAAMEERIQKILARGLLPGQTSVLMDSTGAPLVAMHYSLPNDIFKLEMLGGNATVGFELGESLKEKFQSWKCDGENGTLCRGIVSDLKFYPSHLYRPFEIDANNTVTDIVSVVLLNPTTGNKFTENSKFTLRLTANQSLMHDNLTYDCYYWDEEDTTWSLSGVSTDVKNSTTFFCKSKRLSAIFAVIGTVPKMSPAVIAGIVLGVLAALALVAIIAFLAYKKSRTKTMRVSMSKGYHPNE